MIFRQNDNISFSLIAYEYLNVYFVFAAHVNVIMLLV